MNNLLPLSQWVSDTRGANHIVAFEGSQCWTQATLVADVHQLYAELLTRPGDRWALCFDSSYQFIVALLATLHAGKTPVLPGHCREAQLREQQLHFCGVITDIALNLDCPVISPRLLPRKATQQLPSIAQNAGVILFTSGSTGAPSQVFKALSALDEEVRWLAELWGEQLQDCRLAASVSHQHMYGLTFRIMLPMTLGIAIDASIIQFPEQLAALSDKPLLFITSPAFLKRLDMDLIAPACLMTVSAAGMLDDETAQRAGQWLGIPICEIYGTTETGILAWRKHTSAARPWQPFAAIEFIFQDKRWRVRSPLVDGGECYLDDNLEFSAEGQFRLLGRRDRIIKIEEKRISLSEIERRLLALPEILDVAVVPVVRRGRVALGAVVVLKDPGCLVKKHKSGWRDALKQWLEPVAIPRYWRVVERIALNAQSKRSWAQLQELFDETH